MNTDLVTVSYCTSTLECGLSTFHNTKSPEK